MRVDAGPASTGARAPLKIFAVVDAVVAARAAVKIKALVAGERRVGRARRLSGGRRTSMGPAPKPRAVARATQVPRDKGLLVMRASQELPGKESLLSARRPPNNSNQYAYGTTYGVHGSYCCL